VHDHRDHRTGQHLFKLRAAQLPGVGSAQVRNRELASMLRLATQAQTGGSRGSGFI